MELWLERGGRDLSVIVAGGCVRSMAGSVCGVGSRGWLDLPDLVAATSADMSSTGAPWQRPLAGSAHTPFALIPNPTGLKRHGEIGVTYGAHLSLRWSVHCHHLRLSSCSAMGVG
ncbi:hypothetical protein AKJ16_DCAP24141 [Drosera capensis]